MMFVPGDVLLFRRNKPIANAIRLIEGNPYAHCAVVVRAGNEHTAWVAEIDADIPLRVVPFEVARIDGTVEVYRNKNLTFSGDAMTIAALARRGMKYNFPAILQAMINHLFGRILGWFKVSYRYRNFFPGINNLICSTSVSMFLNRGNENYPYNPCSEPDDYCKDPWVKINE